MNPHIQSLGWVWRRTPDPEPTIAFYRDVLGLPVLRSNPGESAMLWTGETSVLWITTGGSRPPEYTDRAQQASVPIFRCRGIDDVEQRVVASGARILQSGTTHDSRLTYFVDPSGNITGLQERAGHMLRIEDQEANRRWAAGRPAIPGAPALPDDIQGLDWVLMFGVDPRGTTIPFYRDVLGLDLTDPQAGMLWLGETALLGQLGGGSAQPIPSDRAEVNNGIILRVHGIEELVADLKAKGVRFVNDLFPARRGNNNQLAYFVDPEGRLMGLQQRGIPVERVEDEEAERRWAARQA